MYSIVLKDSDEVLTFLRQCGLEDKAALIYLIEKQSGLNKFIKDNGVKLNRTTCPISSIAIALYRDCEWLKYAMIVCECCTCGSIGAFEARFGNKLDKERIDGVKYAISTLEQRYLEILSLKYLRDRVYSNDELGEQLNIPVKYVKNRVDRALNCLKHPSRFGFIKYGYHTQCERQGVLTVEGKHEAEKRFYTQRASLPTQVIQASILNCGFSVRTVNSLQKGGFFYLGQITSQSQLKRLRGMGLKSLTEVVEYFKSLGLDLPL